MVNFYLCPSFFWDTLYNGMTQNWWLKALHLHNCIHLSICGITKMELIIKNLWPTSYGTDVKSIWLSRTKHYVSGCHITFTSHQALFNAQWESSLGVGGHKMSISAIVLLIAKTLFCRYFWKNSIDSHYVIETSFLP